MAIISVTRLMLFLGVTCGVHSSFAMKAKPAGAKKIMPLSASALVLTKGLQSSCEEYATELARFAQIQSSLKHKETGLLTQALKKYHRPVTFLLKHMREEGLLAELERCALDAACEVDIPIKTSLLLQCQNVDNPNAAVQSARTVLIAEMGDLDEAKAIDIARKMESAFLHELTSRNDRVIVLSKQEIFKFPIIVKLLMGRLLETYIALDELAKKLTAAVLPKEVEEQIGKDTTKLKKWASALLSKMVSFLIAGSRHWKEEAERIYVENRPTEKGLSFKQALKGDKKLAPATVLENMLILVKKFDPFMRCLRTHQKLIAIPVSRLDHTCMLFILNQHPSLRDAAPMLLSVMEEFSKPDHQGTPGASEKVKSVQDITHDFVLDFLKYVSVARARGRIWEALVAVFFLKNGLRENAIGALEGINKHYTHDAISYSREFDILSSCLLCECKCVNWAQLSAQEIDEKVTQFEDQTEIVNGDPIPRKFLVISYSPLTDALVQTLNRLKIAFVDPNNQGNLVELFTNPVYKLTC